MNIEEVKNEISNLLKIDNKDIFNVTKNKKGMTNESFFFEYDKTKYIIKFPKKSTNEIVNRTNETETINVIKELDIFNEVIYIDKPSGTKILKYIENVHPCSDKDDKDIELAIHSLQDFHNRRIIVDYEFDFFEMINLYEKNTKISDLNTYINNYEQYKERIERTLSYYLNRCTINKQLCHIDFICDNVLIGKDKTYLIDWEYAAMQDPHVDISMFCVYSNYRKEQSDKIIDLYFENNCDDLTRNKIYSYMAVASFLWSIWSVIMINNGSDYKEYLSNQLKVSNEYLILAEDYINGNC